MAATVATFREEYRSPAISNIRLLLKIVNGKDLYSL